jgi:hypothetical protein
MMSTPAPPEALVPEIVMPSRKGALTHGYGALWQGWKQLPPAREAHPETHQLEELIAQLKG